ncbi:MAG: aspartate-semialdehyde dehydrogenase [Alphaproteobacteria bacterium]
MNNTTQKPLRIAIAGATGAVGREILNILQTRNLPIQNISLLASPKSEGKIIQALNQNITVQNLETFNFSQCDIALFSPGAAVSAIHAPKAAQQGCLVIDNTSHFRMKPNTPLIVPEVNGNSLTQRPPNNIIANPNCSTIQLVMALHPLRQISALHRIIADTYQATSGAGNKGSEELIQQTQNAPSAPSAPAASVNLNTQPKKFSRQIAFNVIPQVDDFLDNGSTREEWKMQVETQKILNLPNLPIQVTCVRVPVMVSHALAAHIEFKKPISINDATAALSQFNGVTLANKNENFISPLEAQGKDPVYVSRLRKDPSVNHGLSMWIVADNLRKGAALNAVQIAELAIQKQFLK